MGNFYDKKSYSGFRYNDDFFKIKWPFKPKVISKKDNEYQNFDLNQL
jgi:dTDP-4-dehydrorhamnose 3,5-epimerase-like enzyme